MVQGINFQKEKKQFNCQANLYPIIGFIPNSILYFIPFYLVWQEYLNIIYLEELTRTVDLSSKGQSDSLVMIHTMIVGIALHVLIDGITWSAGTENGLRSIRFGMML
ncbi:MAG TPA: hypothetical protein DCX89_07520 [Saprospirales bacterium]|nr:hypothetical protein [Saprospirales bacterium]HRQ30316.1 hypothetical protein [Saprospiraceae bacterium]